MAQVKEKTVWQCDLDGYLLGEITLAKRNGDYGKSGWLIPAGCVEEEPPEEKENMRLRWMDVQWIYEEVINKEKNKESEEELSLYDQLNGEFQEEKQILMEAYITAQIRNDVELQQEIQEELKQLELEYQQKRILVENGIDPWSKEAIG